MRKERSWESIHREFMKYWRSLPPEKRKSLTKKDKKKLKEEGLIDEEGNLTSKGELKLLQLKTLKWMVDNPRKD